MKSCATPPVSCPIASIFWACNSSACACCRARSGALAAQLLHCVPGSSKNRQRRAVWSRFLRLLVVLISISRPWQSARSGWVIALHVIDAYAHWPEDHVIERIGLGKNASLRPNVAAWWKRVRQRSSTDTAIFGRMMEADAAPFENLQPDHGPRCTRCCSPLHSRPLSLIDVPEHLLNQAGAATFNPAQEKRRLRQRANKSAGCLHPAPAVRRY